MAVSVNTQTNPTPQNVGSDASKATVITSGFTTGTVTYQIQAKDTDSFALISVASDIDASTYPQVVSISATALQIILPGRIRYQTRARQDAGAWTAWVDFKSRDKVYTTPHAITQLSDDTHTTADTKTARTITVTNSATSTEATSGTGTQVTNSDYWYVTTTDITDTSAGATVTNSE